MNGRPKIKYGFKYLRGLFPQVSEAKLKQGIFIGPQIEKLIRDPAFEETNSKELTVVLEGGERIFQET